MSEVEIRVVGKHDAGRSYMTYLTMPGGSLRNSPLSTAVSDEALADLPPGEYRVEARLPDGLYPGAPGEVNIYKCVVIDSATDVSTAE